MLADNRPAIMENSPAQWRNPQRHNINKQASIGSYGGGNPRPSPLAKKAERIVWMSIMRFLCAVASGSRSDKKACCSATSPLWMHQSLSCIGNFQIPTPARTAIDIMGSQAPSNLSEPIDDSTHKPAHPGLLFHSFRHSNHLYIRLFACTSTASILSGCPELRGQNDGCLTARKAHCYCVGFRGWCPSTRLLISSCRAI